MTRWKNEPTIQRSSAGVVRSFPIFFLLLLLLLVYTHIVMLFFFFKSTTTTKKFVFSSFPLSLSLSLYSLFSVLNAPHTSRSIHGCCVAEQH